MHSFVGTPGREHLPNPVVQRGPLLLSLRENSRTVSRPVEKLPISAVENAGADGAPFSAICFPTFSPHERAR